MSTTQHFIRSSLLVALASGVFTFGESNASAATNQFRGVNWADSRDNFQPGVLYISGLSSSDTYDSAFATGNAIVSQFMSKLGSNSVRMPINEPTVSTYWKTYTGAIDAALSKGKVVLCYWDSAKTNKPADMNAFWAMWKTVVDKYGANENAYFEVFNEPNMYSKNDLVALYSEWLTRHPTVPKGRVILDGTGNAQNVPDVGSATALNGCLLAVHDYSFFGSDTWTSESQWVSHFKGEVGSYADRTICTEWGGPMSPGSKNGVNYGSLDYSKSPSNYFEAYIRGMSSQLRAWNMGSFYWPGLRDGDWYSMTTKTGTGANITLSVSNQSGLQQLQNAWGPLQATGGTGAGGNANSGGTSSGVGGNITMGGAGNVGLGGRSAAGGRNATGGSGGSASASGGASSGGLNGAGGSSAGAPASSGGAAVGQGGAALGAGGAAAATGGATTTGGRESSGGVNGAATGGRPIDATPSGSDSSGCSCTIERASTGRTGLLSVVVALIGVTAARRSRWRGRRS